MAQPERVVTAEQLREELAQIHEREHALSLEFSRLVLELEELEGRPDSHAARFARAHLADDLEAMTAARVETIQEHAAQFHAVPEEDVLRRAGFRVVVAEPESAPAEG